MTLFLALETSCDETAAAIFDDALHIRANVVASQTDLHARFGGVVPELAARAHLQRLLPVLDEALRQAGATLQDLSAVAVMNTPGLVGSLLIGVSAAKMLAVALELPLIAVNHIEAHVYACRLAAGRDIFPAVGLVVSGGHTVLFHCRSALEFELLGATLDDAAGEAFDKAASMLNLGFPGGPRIEKEAAQGNSQAFRFPRAFLHEPRLDFSFSGLKTALLYTIRQLGYSPGTDLPATLRSDLAASFQQAIIDVLVNKCAQALDQTGLTRLCVGGGVAANKTLRRALQAMCDQRGAELFVPPMSLCTDNAAMAAMAVELYQLGQFAPLDLDAIPTYRPRRALAISN
ncbi:MAG: tRNA (adenosine(37)-N6)-threonylcarbamoyltransferase complex transferase subunit TsaD [Gemmatales bacterium]|nr:tRNA (adenosine(37)-N6)-threonylcarbamoyltransferase complex transferase subunit TsaD [Gemmatales bacterium]MCS7159686.1 tRNA (adenosine(37)-N6)-threonylcarbamoyltransferase complex transferase subunit TsaD [Gemmatales bacterium]MDW8174884.1 tRNA (adenosine(37)-N6)-threonylcarbamoyltransferase complex transferase subunit TsaD [Gemmatales bacterium]MDW8222611.1 tRNA (adenosine(37)-N6)-threonylcarbamoyltransferase complex transferase subunit TsaD [Gemmatales bacterium]